MLHKTEGIVLSSVKYKESSLIVKIFTAEFGLLSYVVNSVRTAKPRFHSSVFQSLNIVELVTYYSANKSIQRFSEIKPIFISSELEVQAKVCIKLFLAEFLDKYLKEESKNIELFHFLKTKLLELNLETEFANFHLYFLADFTEQIGVSIRETFQLDTSVLDDENTEALRLILENKVAQLSRHNRIKLLHFLLNYLNQYHLVGELKSIEILSELLD
jgi:DNA repair protein RecO (recombination protein O)